ncbi:Subtilase family protein isoform 1 [Hibiscus syriacus]|uniref:Subtilase family protein isoform 1 n=1 Tax=Hibiscus syriacus TaxID=106335 RepID=A0A6A3BZN9_HIBSY|nr:Subtilase family protein isoform 1 [Hibiscus syriacus]
MFKKALMIPPPGGLFYKRAPFQSKHRMEQKGMKTLLLCVMINDYEHQAAMMGKIVLLLLIFIATASNASKNMQAYIVHMDKTMMTTSDQSPGNSKQWYESLSTKQLESLKGLDGFLSATTDEMLSLHTTRSPQFLGLEPGKGLWSASYLESDVIIGVVDSGIRPEHVSFNYEGLPPVPIRWKGACEEGTKFLQSNCSRKLIGARAFFQGYEAAVGRINGTKDYRSARDAEGHGTHTASTAAAIDQAIADGVDVLSLSLGGSDKPYYSDNIAIGSFHAIKNGVFVSCSAGNSGPSSSIVSNTSPWIMTIAASYLDRSFETTVKLGDGEAFEGSSLYVGKATKQLRLVYANSAGDISESYCVDGSLKKKIVKNKIVVCQ